MAKYSFNDEEDLGKTIEQAQPFCSLSPKSPIRGISQVTGDLAGHKFSKLCGFIFKSKAPGAYSTFLIVYCPKLRGNFIRNDRGLSGWYCWKHIGFQNEMVMSRQDMLNVFGFNVDKFFQSDMFEKWLPKFQAQVQASLGTVVKDFIGKLGSSQRKEAEFYVNAVKASLEKMGDVVKAGEDGSEQAKLAYNADFNYALREEEQEADESVMDYPKEEGLCRDVWEERLTLDGTGVEYALTDEAEWKVQSLADFIQERAGAELTRVHITGSMTSNSWSKGSDIDVHFLGPDLCDEDAEKLNGRIRELYEGVYRAERPEMCEVGGHALEVYFQANEFQDLMSVGCYDFTSREWLVGPELKDSSFSPWSEYYRKVQEKSESVLQQVRGVVMRAYEKAVVCIKALKGPDKSFWEEQSQEMERLLEKGSELLGRIRQMRKAYSSPQSAEQALEWRGSRKWKIADASFKLMDKYGYTAILKQMKQSLEKMRASQDVGEKMSSLEAVVQAVRSSLGSPEKLADSEKQYFVEVDQSLNGKIKEVTILEPFKKEKHQTDWGYVIYFNNTTGRFALYVYDDDPKNVYLANVDIWEPYQNQGLGSQMLKFAISQAKAIGGEQLRLKCLANSKAQKFYEHRNFRFLKNDIDNKYIWMVIDIAKEHSLEQMDEGLKEAISASLLAALLAIPGILSAKTIQQSISNNQKYGIVMNDLNQKIRMIGEYNAFQAANIIARTLYAEARTDGEVGMKAVASVIYNRADGKASDFANVCKKHGYSRKAKRVVHQFSCWNRMTDEEWSQKNFKIKIPKAAKNSAKERMLWETAKKIAADMLSGSFTPTTDANMYYAPKKCSPDWAKELTGTVMVGSHKFGKLKNHSAFK